MMQRKFNRSVWPHSLGTILSELSRLLAPAVTSEILHCAHPAFFGESYESQHKQHYFQKCVVSTDWSLKSKGDVFSVKKEPNFQTLRS